MVFFERKKRGRPEWLKEFGKYSTLGIQFTATFLAFGAIGYFIDKWAGTFPFLMILGIFIGAAAGFMKLYYTLFPPKEDDK